MKEGDPCPNCGDKLQQYIRFGKDTGLLVCPGCWSKYDFEGRRIKRKPKPVRYADSLRAYHKL